MIARTLLLAALLLSATAAQACINSIGTDNQGHAFFPDWIVGDELREHLTGQLRRDRQMLQAKDVIAVARAMPNYEHLNNLGVVLVYQGQYPLAIRHFLTIERRWPGRYETAANLGTALELAGYDQVALRWIRIGMRRNHDAHMRSEWLHARILESKIALAKDPDYLATRSVAGVDFGDALVPSMPPWIVPPADDAT